MKLLQVSVSGTRAQVTTQNLYASVVLATASAASTFLGDDTVTTSNGIAVPTTSALPIAPCIPRGIPLNSLYVVGTSGTLNILYEPSA